MPPVEYFAAMAEGLSVDGGKAVPVNVYIEAHENYQKQSYRNRCLIFASHGSEAITVPIVHEGNTFALPITQIRVDYSTPWVERAVRTLDSAYRTAPFYEYYRDSLTGILLSKPERLWDLNMSLTAYLASKMGLPVVLNQTESFSSAGESAYGEDFRSCIHPKRPSLFAAGRLKEKPYYQVFALKHGFISNLSAADLLFNEGPESVSYLLP